VAERRLSASAEVVDARVSGRHRPADCDRRRYRSLK
jgi:hypothetical protein